MTLKFRVFKHSTTRNHNALACDIAVRCADAVVQRMRAHTAHMEVPELRGYVRARALPIICADVAHSLAELDLPLTLRHKLTDMALERTVHLVVRELHTPPVITIPAPHVPMRAAA